MNIQGLESTWISWSENRGEGWECWGFSEWGSDALSLPLVGNSSRPAGQIAPVERFEVRKGQAQAGGWEPRSQCVHLSTAKSERRVASPGTTAKHMPAAPTHHASHGPPSRQAGGMS